MLGQREISAPPKTLDGNGSIRVALVAFNFAEYCIRLASALAQNAEVLLMLPEEQAQPHVSLLNPAVFFHSFPVARLRHAVQQLNTLHKLHQRIRRFSPDVVHLQAGYFWFNLFLPWLRHPFVLTIHDCQPHLGDLPSQKTPRWIGNIGYRRADEIIAHTEYVKQSILANHSIDPHRVHVIPHIKLGQEMVRTEAVDDENTILFFGRIWEYKGLEYLIRAEPLIRAEVPDAKIVIAGTGEDFSRYRRMMANPESFVVHNRYISDAERSEMFRKASVVVLPYIEATQSGVVPLAYTFGKPVVATTVGGLPETVYDGRTGFCVPPRDERALAQAIVRLLRNPALRKEFGENGNRMINSECSPSTVAMSTLNVYRCAQGRSVPRKNRLHIAGDLRGL